LNKQLGAVFVLGTILLVTLIYGGIYSKAKMQRVYEKERAEFIQEEADKKAKEKAEKEKRAAEKAAEEKRVYEAHKGESLIYSPMGDSLADGYAATTPEQRYIARFTKLLHEKMGYNVQLAEGAVKGGTGISDEALPNIDKLRAQQPDLITIQFGNNDHVKDKKDAYVTPGEFKKKLETLVDELVSFPKKPKIILITTWNSGGTSLTFDQIIEDVGKEKNVEVTNIQELWQGRTDTFGPAGVPVYKGKSDEWHPNNKGHKEIAEKLFNTAYETLK